MTRPDEEPATEHWNRVYRTRAPAEVSWYQRDATPSLALVEAAGVAREAPVLDVGAGASTFVDGLLARGHSDITLLDIAEAAFEPTRARLGARADAIRFIAADVTTWKPERTYALWHDRAVFHFLVDPAQRDAYRAALRAALAPGGKAIIATFAADGPERCSGLPVRRYSPPMLAEELDEVLRFVEARPDIHHTPAGGSQSFVFALFERR